MSFVLDCIFGERATVEELVDGWTKKLRGEQRKLEGLVRDIEKEEVKAKEGLRAAALMKDEDTCKMVARELLLSGKAKERLGNNKAQLNSVVLMLGEQLQTYKLAGVMKMSTKIMKVMNSLVKLPELQQTVQEMSREMAKAGLIQEVMAETLGALDGEGFEQAADEEVRAVIEEVTRDLLTQGPVVPKGEEMEEDDLEAERLKKRLNALAG